MNIGDFVRNLSMEGDQLAFGSPTFRNYFQTLFSAEIQSDADRYAFAATIHAASHAINHRTASSRAATLSLHFGDSSAFCAGLAGTRPQLMHLILPYSADFPNAVSALQAAGRTVEAVFVGESVSAETLQVIRAKLADTALIGVYHTRADIGETGDDIMLDTPRGRIGVFL